MTKTNTFVETPFLVASFSSGSLLYPIVRQVEKMNYLGWSAPLHRNFWKPKLKEYENL